MSRLTTADQVFFPVEVRELYADVGEAGYNVLRRVANRKAIVNARSQTVLGVVSSGYRLITNQEAMEAAHECCSVVFPETHPSEWSISAVDAPATASYCHIDLAHNTTTLEFEYLMKGARKEVPDAFGPFIRVSNSYNGSRALAFSIGFYRKVCANGLVSPEEVVRFRFDHTRRDMKSVIKFHVEQDRLSQMKQSFVDCFQALQECTVEQRYFVPLIQSILWIREPRQAEAERQRSLSKREPEEWSTLQAQLNALSDKYAGEQGENAYAVLNAVTDLASHPPKNRCIRRDKHSLQKRAGEWLITFKSECRESAFSIPIYLAKMVDGEEASTSRRRNARSS